MLWPHYGLHMCQAAALLLVPDIPLTDKKTVKKSLQLTLQLIYCDFALPNVMMSGMTWAIF